MVLAGKSGLDFMVRYVLSVLQKAGAGFPVVRSSHEIGLPTAAARRSDLTLASANARLESHRKILLLASCWIVAKVSSDVSKVVTFGEIMLRLSPPGFQRFCSSPIFRCHIRRRRSQCCRDAGQFRCSGRFRHTATEKRSRRRLCELSSATRSRYDEDSSRRRSSWYLLSRKWCRPERQQSRL